jgi:hypothetical protein
MVWPTPPMAVTVIRAIANMHRERHVLISRCGRAVPIPTSYPSDGPQAEAVIPPLDAVGELDFPIPWCRSAEEFNNLHLSLAIVTLSPGYAVPGPPLQEYRIWQQDIAGVDLVRFTSGSEFEPNARGLAGSRRGDPPYFPDRDADVLLVVDERPWVILKRIR